MHIRASMSRGMPVVDDASQDVAGMLGDPVLNPDTGDILGFFVTGSLSGELLFLQIIDIVGWGMQVHVRSADRLAPPDEIIRLRRLFQDRRTMLGQPILTKTSKRSLGRCHDVQFNTHHFTLEWIFPRKFFVERQPVPAADIVEVTTEAVWVNDPLRPTAVRVAGVGETRSGKVSVPEIAPGA